MRGARVKPLPCPPLQSQRLWQVRMLPLPSVRSREGGCGVLLDAPVLVLATEELVGFFVLFSFVLLRLSLANAKGKAAIYIHVCLRLSVFFLSQFFFFIYQRIKCLWP